MEILDAQGRTITHVHRNAGSAAGGRGGGRGGAAAAETDEEGGGGRGGPPARVAVKQGMNRFTWDMRYPGARDFPGLIMWAGSTRGPPKRRPARYQVKLTAAGVDADAGLR